VNSVAARTESGVRHLSGIIALMPPHDTYVELFAGSSAAMHRKPPAARFCAAKLNPRPLASILEVDAKGPGDQHRWR